MRISDWSSDVCSSDLRLSRHLDQFVVRGGDAGLVGKSQGNLLPDFHAVFVGLLGKLRDEKISVLIDDRGFRPRAAAGCAGGEDELKVIVGFLVPENSPGDLKQPSELDTGGNAGGD